MTCGRVSASKKPFPGWACEKCTSDGDIKEATYRRSSTTNAKFCRNNHFDQIFTASKFLFHLSGRELGSLGVVEKWYRNSYLFCFFCLWSAVQNELKSLVQFVFDIFSICYVFQKVLCVALFLFVGVYLGLAHRSLIRKVRCCLTFEVLAIRASVLLSKPSSYPCRRSHPSIQLLDF